MTHVLDSGELASVRKHPQTLKRYLCFVPEEVIWTGRVNGNPALDAQSGGIYGFFYDGESSPYPSPSTDMTVYIGTVAGGKDIGKFRLRNGNSAINFMGVNETAAGEVPVANDHYITVTNQRRIWQKRIRRIADESGLEYTEYIDYAITYYDQNTDGYPGIINITRDTIGNPYLPAGRYDVGQNYRTVDLSAHFSFLPKNSGALTFSWFLPTGVTLAPTYDDNDVTVKVRVTQGCHEIRLLMQWGGIYGLWRTLYVWAFPRDDDTGLITQFTVTKDEREDGREMDFEVFEPIDTSLMPEGTIVCYWEDDISFGGDNPPDSYVRQYLGWTLRDATLMRLFKSRYSIQTGGPMSVLDKIGGYPQTYYDPRNQEDPDGQPTKFIEMPDNTPDLMVHTLLWTYTTVLDFINLYFSDYQPPIEGFTFGDGSIKAQINSVVERYFGFAACDTVGSMYLNRHFAYLTDDERLTIDAVITIDKQDWDDKNPPDFIEEKNNKIRQLDLYGTNYDILYDDDDNIVDFSKIWHAVAPGIVQSDGISFESSVSVFLQTSQAGLNQLKALAGRHYARLNNKRPDLTLPLKGNFDFIEPAWGEPIRINYTDDNVRDLTITNRAFLVKRVTVQHSMDPKKPDKKVSWTLEQVTGGDAGSDIPTIELPETEPYPVDPYNPVPEYTVDMLPTKLVGLDANGPKFATAELWNPVTGAIVWDDKSTGLSGNGIWLSADPYDYRRYFALTTAGLFRCENVWVVSPSWSQVATNADIFGGDSSGRGNTLIMSINLQGWIAIGNGNGNLSVSFNSGASWSFVNLGGGTPTASAVIADIIKIGLAVSPYNNGSEGWLYATNGFAFGGNGPRLWKSTDWGLTWSVINVATGGIAGLVTPNINIPYIRSDGTTPNANDSSQEILLSGGQEHSSNSGAIVRSQNGGTSFSALFSLSSAGTAVPAGSFVGSSIQTFTWDGARIIAATLATGAGGNQGGAIITDDSFSAVLYRAGLTVGGGNNNSHVNGFPLHSQFCIFWNRSGSSGMTRWTFDDGASWITGTMPSFFTDLGSSLRHFANIQADLSDFVPPPAA